MLGLELYGEARPVYEGCLKRRLLINCTQKNVLRIMPQIRVSRSEIDRAVDILDSVLKNRENR